jgi:hypothetical protein
MSKNGRNPATQLQPAPVANRRAVTHGAYVTFTPVELEEVRALVADPLHAEVRTSSAYRSSIPFAGVSCQAASRAGRKERWVLME